MIPKIDISMSDPPEERWRLSDEHLLWARELIQRTVDEVGGIAPFRNELMAFADTCVSHELAGEIRNLANQTGAEYVEALAANLYYDFIKLILGCTAFAVNTDEGPLHARNMDWFSHGNCLSDFTAVLNFLENGKARFQAVGWPGAVGVLSAISPGRFTVTLNAVLSDEPMQMATPVAFLIRDVCQNADSFQEAIEMLSSTPTTSDCLLLVTGTNYGEMVVVERTPTRHAIREAKGDYIVVTNDYRALDCERPDATSEIYETACGRFDAATQRLNKQLPCDAEQCFSVLNDPEVRMQITVQQMVMSAKSGLLNVRTAHHHC